MPKTIFVLGGGTFGEPLATYKNWSMPVPEGRTHYDETTTPVDKLILKATGKPKSRLLLIFTASEDGQHDLKLLEEGFRAHFEKLGARMDTLYLITQRPSQAEIEKKIASADAVYVSGGNTFGLMRAWKRYGVDKLLLAAWQRGTVMSGMSAGSICWFAYGNSDSFYARTKKLFRVTGMGWLPLLICPHYDTESNRQTPLKEMLKRTPGMAGVALDEHAALEVVDDAYRIHFFKLGAEARKCYWTGGKYVIEPLVASTAYKPLADLLNKP
jgi:dipeptidase E